MAIVFQHSALFDSLTVADNVGYRLMEEESLPLAEIRQIVSQALEFVGLAGTDKKMPWELSGGMKKRVAIARALASGAETILFDEPTAGLDPINANNITHFITHLRDSKAVTSIVVTHDLHHAFEVASRVALLDGGELIFEGSVADLKKSKDKRVISFVSPSDADLVSSQMDAIMSVSRKRLERMN
jgi:phospholipid/cholesterol/gamma-HCH transport system ATP-binding protein